MSKRAVFITTQSEMSSQSSSLVAKRFIHVTNVIRIIAVSRLLAGRRTNLSKKRFYVEAVKSYYQSLNICK